MNNYITGTAIKQLREKHCMTQAQLADKLAVSSKTVSKWETAKGLPDISLIEPLAKALGVSIAEFFSGNIISNSNVCANMLRSRLYVCPVCGNVICAAGESVITCCGIALPVCEAEECDGTHGISIENVENEYFVSISHPMSKEHYISFIAYMTCDRFETVKLYPEGNAEARFAKKGGGIFYAYCNQHGLYKLKL